MESLQSGLRILKFISIINYEGADNMRKSKKHHHHHQGKVHHKVKKAQKLLEEKESAWKSFWNRYCQM